MKNGDAVVAAGAGAAVPVVSQQPCSAPVFAFCGDDYAQRQKGTLGLGFVLAKTANCNLPRALNSFTYRTPRQKPLAELPTTVICMTGSGPNEPAHTNPTLISRLTLV